MKTQLLFGLAGLFCGAAGAADISVEDLRLKNAPAFFAIGVEPTSVERPTSAKRFGMALAGTFNNTGGENSVGNVAIETSPFWWFGGSKLTFDEYYGVDPKKPLDPQTDHQDVFENALRTFTLSVATKANRIVPTEGDSTGSSLGVGFRSSLLIGKLSKVARLKKMALQKKLGTLAQSISTEDMSDLKLFESRESKEELPSPAPAKAFEGVTADIKALREAVQNPEGFQLEAAGGFGFESDKKNLSNAKYKRGGVWLNGSYRLRSTEAAASSLDVIGTVRYLHTKLPTDVEFDNFDVGARLVWATARQPLSASAEYVQRFRNKSAGNTKRFSVILEYAISDTAAIYLTNGKGFDENGSGRRESFAFAGVNFSLGKPGSVKL